MTGEDGGRTPDLTRAALDDGDRLRLVAVLARARDLGFLGPSATPDEQLDHAQGLATVLRWALAEAGTEGPIIDLGSGAGMPGLVVATMMPECRVVLLDAHARRMSWTAEVVIELGLTNVEVTTGRAEIVGRSPARRETAAAVVARGFGPPATTAECAAALVKVGGVVVVSEPPEGSPPRWPDAGLARLSLSAAGLVRCDPSTAMCLRKTGRLDNAFPRRDGVPRKRPLF